MGLFDKIKDFVNVSEEEYFGDVDATGEDDSYYQEPPAPRGGYSAPPAREAAAPVPSGGKVVDIRSTSRPHVVFKKLDRFEDVGAVADVLNEKRIVILNLESCPNDVARRIIDFLYGVAYANSGELKRVAGRAYIITPYNVPVTGELLDEIESSGFGSGGGSHGLFT